MDRFDVRIMGRRSGKTSKLRQLIEEEVAKGEYKVIAMATTYNCLKNLTIDIGEETKHNKNYQELSFRASGGLTTLRGLGKIKIFFDEIYLLDYAELEQLQAELMLNPNIELISYSSYRQ